jgi:hypothetical protein
MIYIRTASYKPTFQSAIYMRRWHTSTPRTIGGEIIVTITHCSQAMKDEHLSLITNGVHALGDNPALFG